MGFDAAWALAADTLYAVMGLPATVTRPVPNDTPVSARMVWLSPPDEPQPFGVDLQRRDPRRVLALQRSIELDAAPRGTIIAAAEVQGGTVKTWRVDQAAQPVRPDELRVFVVEV
jgi:hypothetical protein